MRSKLALPPAVAVPAFRALHTLRHLRGTPLDVFGWTRIRRMERSLLREYEELISDINRNINLDTYGSAVALAALPDMVRGYEHVKVASVHRYRAEVDRLMAQIHGSGT